METIGNYKEYYKIAYNPAYLKAGFLILSLSNIIFIRILKNKPFYNIVRPNIILLKSTLKLY